MSKRRVLVYDDDPEAVGRLLVLLTLLGHEAVGTLHVCEGTEALDSTAVDLLLARYDLRGHDLAVFALAKRPSVEIAFIGGGCTQPGDFLRYPLLEEPYTREQLEALLLRAFALHAVKVAASRYIEAVRAACFNAGSSASSAALAAAAEHIEVVRRHSRTVQSRVSDGAD